jgi:hypothetical protein
MLRLLRDFQFTDAALRRLKRIHPKTVEGEKMGRQKGKGQSGAELYRDSQSTQPAFSNATEATRDGEAAIEAWIRVLMDVEAKLAANAAV